MKPIDKTWKAVVDPGYSVLGLAHSVGRDNVLYLDVVTGWPGSRGRTWPALERRARRDRLK